MSSPTVSIFEMIPKGNIFEKLWEQAKGWSGKEKSKKAGDRRVEETFGRKRRVREAGENELRGSAGEGHPRSLKDETSEVSGEGAANDN